MTKVHKRKTTNNVILGRSTSKNLYSMYPKIKYEIN